MSKHTPGPWKVRFFPNNDSSFFVEAPTYEGHPYHGITNGGFGILGDENYPTKLADARLVSAAPELLIALKTIEQYRQRLFPPPFGHDCQWCSTCRLKLDNMVSAAIEKAEG